jgi:hypothetical protein
MLSFGARESNFWARFGDLEAWKIAKDSRVDPLSRRIWSCDAEVEPPREEQAREFQK